MGAEQVEQHAAIGSPSYFAKHGHPKTLDNLAAHNCLGFMMRETRLGRQWRFVREGVEATVTPKGNMSFTDGAALCDAARAGCGLAQMHGYYVDDPMRAGELEPVLEKFKPPVDPIWLVYPQTRQLSPKVRAFIDFMVASFRQTTARMLGAVAPASICLFRVTPHKTPSLSGSRPAR